MGTERVENNKTYFQDLNRPFESLRHSCSIAPRQVHMLGFGFDGTACFRKGAKKGPFAIRETSFGIESYSPYLERDLEELESVLVDLGDLKLGTEGDIVENYLKTTNILSECISSLDLKKSEAKFLLLGGEHSVSYGQIKEYLRQYDDLALLHLDAHADLRDGYEGYHYSHASIIKRALDHFKKNHELFQYGVRSGTKKEYQWMKEKGTLSKTREGLFEKLNNLSDSRPLYLTLDLDFFDPSFFPGTGTPEVGGEDFHFFIKLLKILKNKNFVGADVVELAPDIDSTGNSSIFAAKVVRELLIALSWSLYQPKI